MRNFICVLNVPPTFPAVASNYLLAEQSFFKVKQMKCTGFKNTFRDQVSQILVVFMFL